MKSKMISVLVITLLTASGCVSLTGTSQKIDETVEDKDVPIIVTIEDVRFDLTRQNWGDRYYEVNDPEMHRFISAHLKMRVAPDATVESSDESSDPYVEVEYNFRENFQLTDSQGNEVPPVVVGIDGPNMFTADGFIDLSFNPSVTFRKTLRPYDVVVVFLHEIGQEVTEIVVDSERFALTPQ